jgi:hypothetical protein
VTTIYLARHGETDWNAQARWQGHADTPLNERGRTQAQALAGRLAAVPFAAAYASDLRRARETAEIVVDGRDLPLRIDPRLREIDVGSWQGLTNDEIAGLERTDGETLEAFRAPAGQLAADELEPCPAQCEGGAARVVAAVMAQDGAQSREPFRNHLTTDAAHQAPPTLRLAPDGSRPGACLLLRRHVPSGPEESRRSMAWAPRRNGLRSIGAGRPSPASLSVQRSPQPRCTGSGQVRSPCSAARFRPASRR